MALVKNPLMSMMAKGSIEGMTISKCPSGYVAKKKANPVKRSEYYKQTNRTRISFLSRQYGQLTAGQRESWEDWATDHPQPDGFGGTFIMSGINAFVSLNFNAMRLGAPGDWNVLPPVIECPASIATFTAATGVGVPGDIDMLWTMNGVPLVTDFVEVQIAGPFQSQARKIVYSQFREILHPSGTSPGVTSGGLDEGMWYWHRARYIDEYGQKSPWVYAQATPMLTP